VRFAIAVLAALTLFAPGLAAAQKGNADADRGVQLYLKGDYEGSLRAMDAAIAAGVTSHPQETVLTIRGNALGQLGRYDEAIAAHRKALEANPRSHEAWVNLGIVYRRKGEYAEAEKCYLKALEIEPNYAELHASLGALYVFRDDPQKAVRSLERAISLDRNLPVAHANMAIANAMLGKFDQADSDLRRAIVLGYKNGPAARQRIDALKAAR
jgi:Flp pilus assembly protein TadD